MEHADKISFRLTAGTAASGASATTVASVSGASAANYRYALTHISGDTNLAGNLVTIQSPDGTTVWQQRVAAGTFSHNFDPPFSLVNQASFRVAIAATGTANGDLNAAGFLETCGGA